MLTILLGILSGPVLLSAATVALYAVLDPESLHDGQFRMFCLVTVPFGLLLGCVAGTSAWLVRARGRSEGGRCAARGGGAVLIIALLAWIPWVEFGLFEWLVTFLAAGGLSVVGARLSWSEGRAEWRASLMRRFGDEAHGP
jgi:hypothetical protein